MNRPLADPYAPIDAWRLIVEILRLVPTARVTQYVDEIDGSVLALSDSGWGRCSVRLGASGIEIVAPVLLQPWSWAKYRQEQTPEHFASLVVSSLGGGAPGPRGPLSVPVATLLGSLVALGLLAPEEWYVRALRPVGIEPTNYADLFGYFPGLPAQAVEHFEAVAAAGSTEDPEVDGWVVFCDLQPTLLVLLAPGETWIAPASGGIWAGRAALLTALAKLAVH